VSACRSLLHLVATYRLFVQCRESGSRNKSLSCHDETEREEATMGSSDKHELGNVPAFLVGALVGAGVALLFVPQAGSQLRGLLRDCAARAKDELDDAVDRGADAMESARDRGEEFLEKGLVS
jgi:hypothetical protein